MRDGRYKGKVKYGQGTIRLNGTGSAWTLDKFADRMLQYGWHVAIRGYVDLKNPIM